MGLTDWWIAEIAFENIAKTACQSRIGRFIHVAVDRTLTGEREGTHIIQSVCLVGMIVGPQNSIDVRHRGSDHLLTKIRRGIDNG